MILRNLFFRGGYKILSGAPLRVGPYTSRSHGSAAIIVSSCYVQNFATCVARSDCAFVGGCFFFRARQ